MKIKFVPVNIEVEASPDKTVLQIATENQIQIRSICKGLPSCAECRVHVKDGDYNLPPPTKAELGLIGTSYYLDGRRLSCQLRCFGDVTIDVTEQLENKDGSAKKIRGFKSKTTQTESHAVQGTLVLEEKVEDLNREAGQNREPAQAKRDNSNQQNRDQHHGRRDNNNRDNQNRGSNRNSRR